MMQKKDLPTVIVGLSGGVDSSVSALLLKQAGYRVIGLFMKNWEEEEGICPAKKDYEDVLRVCDQIDIPCFSINFSKEYKDLVFSSFLDEYEKGKTPNPDILCNKKIKFDLFYKKALKEFNGDFLATGHYCQIRSNNTSHYLLRGHDKNKDQSYFLYTIKSDILKNVLFPIGHLTKPHVRKIAHDHHLYVSQKKDSTGICFIGKRDFRPFIKRYLKTNPGPIESVEGHLIGKHDGLFQYTIGQRKGLNIGGKGSAWFVVKKDTQNNKLIVAQGETHPALFCLELIATNLSWIVTPPEKYPFSCTAKIRYRHEDQPCFIESLDKDRVSVKFLSPQRAITSGQSVVFYDKDICLGGGIIN